MKKIYISWESNIELDMQSIILNMNKTQDCFYFEFIATGFEVNNWEIDASEIHRLYISKFAETPPLIYITDKRMTDRHFSHEYLNFSIITIADFDLFETGFNMTSFIMYSICHTLICFSMNKDENEMHRLSLTHKETKGCLFDFCQNKTEIKQGMLSGAICTECSRILIGNGMSQEQLSAVSKILTLVAFNAENNSELSDDRIKDFLSILHISDLHFGNTFRFSPTILKIGTPDVREPYENLYHLHELLINDINRIITDPISSPQIKALALGIDIIVVTGDVANTAGAQEAVALTSGGTTNEYEQAVLFLEDLLSGINKIREVYGKHVLSRSEHVVVVPGNHDVDWSEEPNADKRFSNFAEFWYFLTGKKDYYGIKPNQIFYKNVFNVANRNIFIAGFNSCTVTSQPTYLRDIGIVDRGQLALCDKALKEVSVVIHRKIAVLHHHPCYIPLLSKNKEEYDALLQAGEFLTYLQEKGFDLILHGHKHYPIEFVHTMKPYEINGNSFALWSEPVVISSGSLSAPYESLPRSIPNTYNLIGLRLDSNEFLKNTVCVRRKLVRCGHQDQFDKDSIRFLGNDVINMDANNKRASSISATVKEKESLGDQRANLYEKSDGWMLVHKTRNSELGEQYIYISISLIKHPSYKLSSKTIVSVTYDVGKMFPGSPYIVKNKETNYELLLQAYGTFLCLAKIRFSDKSVITLQRYIDFEEMK